MRLLGEAQNQNPVTTQFASGAKSSPVPRLGSIPYAPLCTLAEHFAASGNGKYPDPWQYRASLSDPEYLIERLEHVANHALAMIAIIRGHAKAEEPLSQHACAIMWGGVVAWEAVQQLTLPSINES